jgi:hypothetical protein
VSETTPQSRYPGVGSARRESDSAALSAAAVCAAMPDLAPAFALGALDPDDVEAVERHRTLCPTCARLVDGATRTAAMLPYLARPTVPAPDIKAALFARIGQAQQVARAAAASAGAPPNPSLVLPASRPLPAEERVAHASRRRLRLPSLAALAGRGRARFGAAAGPEGQAGQDGRSAWGNWPGPALPITTTTVPLMLVLVVVGGWAMSLYNRTTELATYQDLWGTIGNFLADEDGNVYELRPGPDAPPSVTGQVIAELDAGEAIVMVWGLDQSRDDVTYRVVVERGGELVDVGGFDPDDGGNARVMVNLDGPLNQCRRIYVRSQRTVADGSTVALDILSTSISPDGPAAGGEGTGGGQSVGSVQRDVVPLAKK